ncbi:GFA family protein [Sandarakinorhabdus rubra]|uniref:GFA family protein n=1 Tax=Sandarakinorhabdus rubra TaxID=2672568 RepID=UPI0013DA58A6|nr:GFA family protein [Sandarakinorhabdus rubra]
MNRDGQCLCGGVRVVLGRDPPAVNMCHCADCQRRSGSPFGMAVWLMETDVTISGETREFRHLSDKGRELTNRFCPSCGSTICYTAALNPGLVAIPAGLFADPDTPPPQRSVFEERRHPWVAVPEGAVRLPRGRDG